MESKNTKSWALKLVRDCIAMEGEKRPELQWINEKHEMIRKKYGLKSKKDTDKFLYERMYAKVPRKESEYLKFRYWRTGKCLPSNREQCFLYGRALELSEEDMCFLFQAYYDRNFGQSANGILDVEDIEERRKKQIYLQMLRGRYLENIPDSRLRALNIPKGKQEHYYRHLYFVDACSYIYTTQEINWNVLRRHIVSTCYESELTRLMRFQGEIPRKTMIRHLLLLGLPDMTLEKMNEQLIFFGYLPLREDHTLTGGEYLDWLLIQLLKKYEEIRLQNPADDEESVSWFRKVCRIMDEYFVKMNKPRLRFMYFKALDL